MLVVTKYPNMFVLLLVLGCGYAFLTKCIHHEHSLRNPSITLPLTRSAVPGTKAGWSRRVPHTEWSILVYGDVLGLFEDAIREVSSRLFLANPDELGGVESISGCGPRFAGDYWVPPDTSLVVFTDHQAGDPACEPGVAAYAQICTRLTSGRPFSAYVHICDVERASMEVMVHEVYHVFGFSEESFRLYPAGDQLDNVFYPRKPHGALAKITRTDGNFLTGTRTYSVPLTVLISSAPTLYAREFFGCDRLLGVEITDSHLCKRLYYNDLMTPILTSNTLYRSDLTLLILEASGWYHAVLYTNYSLSPWHRAEGKGCSFAMKNCRYYYEKTGDESIFCFHSRDSNCRIFRHPNPVPRNMQYFDDPNYGGLSYVEYCPLKSDVSEPIERSLISASSSRPGRSWNNVAGFCFHILIYLFF